jgi:hypothetical protein
MGLSFPTLVYEPCFEVFARSVTITPNNSQPGAPPYGARGIFDTNSMDIEGEAEEQTFFSTTRTELDILQMEFTVLPVQGDYISIPDDNLLPGGEFVVSDIGDKGNAGGEVTLVLKRREEWKLIGYSFFTQSPDFARPVLTTWAP